MLHGALLYMKIKHLWTFAWTFNIPYNKLKYWLLFIVVLVICSSSTRWNTALAIIWLGGCLTVEILYLLSYLFHLGKWTPVACAENCCIAENSTVVLPILNLSGRSQSFLHTWNNLKFLAGFQDNKPKSVAKCLEIEF